MSRSAYDRFSQRTRYWVEIFLRALFFWKENSRHTVFLSLYQDDLGAHPGAPITGEGFLDERCVACSLCTFSCKAVREGLAPPAFEPKQIPLLFSRGRIASELLPMGWLPCLRCDGCTVECPTGVPIHRLAKSVLESKPVTVSERSGA